MALHNASKLVPLTSQTKLTASVTVSLTVDLTLTLNLTLAVTVGLTLTVTVLNRNISAHIVDIHKKVSLYL